MPAPIFNKRYDNPAEKDWRAGKGPAEFNRLGADPGPISSPKDFANAFVRLQNNPDRDRFYSDRQFPFDVAEQSQKKIDAAFATDEPMFADENTNQRASSFLANYRNSVMIEPDRKISREGLGPLATQVATEGSNERDPNTASKFPNQGVSV
jgi:hypothetical protein